jgi:methyl-accepting chemotaxis protein
MALVKTNKIAPAKTHGAVKPAKTSVSTAQKPAARERTGHNKAAIVERVAAASEQLASGITQSSAAAEELRRSMEQIASGAEEAAGASQEQLAAINRISANLGAVRERANNTRRQTESVQVVLAETALLLSSFARATERNAERQSGSAKAIAELERRAAEISDITRVVSGISDQTNLLALNAAIEAARAGEQGRGFAVVAEEVRALAESSELSAQAIREHADCMQHEVQQISSAVTDAAATAIQEARSGTDLAGRLNTLREDMSSIAAGSDVTLDTTNQAERAAIEAQRGAELVASAAEEQSAAAAEAQSAIQQQAQALEQSQTATQALARQAENLRTAETTASAALDISASAEELSASIQEMSGSAAEIMAAIGQINKGSQQQAAATQQAHAALAQIEKSAVSARENVRQAVQKAVAFAGALRDSRSVAEKLVQGVVISLSATKANLQALMRLEAVSRNIEKIVDTVALVAIQTTMLAVSGAVEAARAGNAGRGFALVSGDIRGLARDTTSNVDRIKDTVRNVRDQITVLHRDLEQVIASNEQEVESNKGVIVSLGRLENDLVALSDMNKDISKGAEDILAAITEATSGARQIAAAAEEASMAATQASAASLQQARGAENLAAAIEEIAALTQELN